MSKRRSVALTAEHRSPKPGAAGSNPAGPAIFYLQGLHPFTHTHIQSKKPGKYVLFDFTALTGSVHPQHRTKITGCLQNFFTKRICVGYRNKP